MKRDNHLARGRVLKPAADLTPQVDGMKRLAVATADRK
jgi:hypothetical protein